ncbi:MAG: O-antigen ligase family protein [Bacteroidota bacterium]
MIEKYKLKWVYLISGLFIAVNALLIAYEFYWFTLLPVAIFVFILFFFSLDRLLILITFLTPLAINIRDFDWGVAVTLPTEPLLFGILILFIIKLLYDRKLDSRILRHPITIALFINLGWMLMTSITSELPGVSFKFMLSRLWFVIPFYFVAIPLFEKKKNITNFTWAYVISLIGVIIYATWSLYTWAFDEQAAHWVMSPFFNDHTAYGAGISFFVPVLAGLLFYKRFNRTTKLFVALALLFLLGGLIFSYSRAAWISVAVALFFGIVLLMKIKLRWLGLGLLVLIIGFFSFRNEILWKLEKNKQDTSANMVEHIESISNISSDASNLERINRWQSAFRMFELRPFWGWGPGTYQFMYAPYQHSKEKTIISTNAGDKGNAHSEYIGPLAESGVLGMLTFIALCITVIATAVRLYKRSPDRDVRLLSLIFLLGLITYLVHGLLNNFLDTDKSSIPFWGFTAIIVALDIYYKGNGTEKKDAESPVLPEKSNTIIDG